MKSVVFVLGTIKSPILVLLVEIELLPLKLETTRNTYSVFSKCHKIEV